jgi:hypothetical protein
LLEGALASPARPYDRNEMKMQVKMTLEWCLKTKLKLNCIYRFSSYRPVNPLGVVALPPPRSNGKPEAATAVDGLLMMGMRMPETC